MIASTSIWRFRFAKVEFYSWVLESGRSDKLRFTAYFGLTASVSLSYRTLAAWRGWPRLVLILPFRRQPAQPRLPSSSTVPRVLLVPSTTSRVGPRRLKANATSSGMACQVARLRSATAGFGLGFSRVSLGIKNDDFFSRAW